MRGGINKGSEGNQERKKSGSEQLNKKRQFVRRSRYCTARCASKCHQAAASCTLDSREQIVLFGARVVVAVKRGIVHHLDGLLTVLLSGACDSGVRGRRERML